MADEKISRKDFLGQSGLNALALLGAGLVSTHFARLAFGAGGAEGETLVVVFLRGACDGLSIAAPISGEDRALYEAARPTLAVPLSGEKAALRLDDRFGFHSSARGLHSLFQAKKLAVIHAAGLPSDSRSHFDAQLFMELGTPNRKNTGKGWIARYLEALAPPVGKKISCMDAIAVGNLLPTSLLAAPQVAVINNLNGFNLTGKPDVQLEQRIALRSMYEGSGWLSRYGTETLEAIDTLEGSRSDGYVPASGADYPKAEIGNRLKSLAQLIKMNLGLRVATVDMGGWDTHKGQEGKFSGNLSQLSEALLAFQADISGRNTTVIVMSEFGRRLKENASRGTDHGHGNIMMVLGERIHGGKVYGKWPGLKTEQLYDRADLAVTTDYRQVVTDVLLGSSRLAHGRVAEIFPGYTHTSLGLFSA
jgi:uncharacterized protein (DUF1501 family)